MRRAFVRALVILPVLLAVSAVSSRPAGVPCIVVSQFCVRCFPSLVKKCKHLQCPDGSTPTSCGQCTIFCSVEE
jgi:hypothetical protein